MSKNEVEIHVKLDDLDEALEKASRLKELLQEIQILMYSIYGEENIKAMQGGNRKES